MYVNKVFIAGRLTRDAEVRILPSGSQVINFTIAMNRPYKDKVKNEWKEETYFIDVELFRDGSSEIAKKLSKGYLVIVEGELKQERWEQNGQQRSKVKVRADKVNFLSKPQSSGLVKGKEEEIDDFEDDIPF